MNIHDLMLGEDPKKTQQILAQTLSMLKAVSAHQQPQQHQLLVA